MALKTRPPTGQGLYPKILVEGPEKSGKSYPAAVLSASPKVGRTAVLVLGEDVSKWDDFGKIPGARFGIIEHDGSWQEIIGAVEDAKEEAAKAVANGEPPFVLVFDTISAEWDGLKDWATFRARNSKKAKEILARDPNAEIDVSTNYWNDARSRHKQMMARLLTFPGIVILIARGDEVTLFENGKPVANKKTWSIDGEKNIGYDVTTHVRLFRDGLPQLISAAGVGSPIKPGDPPLRLTRNWTLESLIFDTLGLDTSTAAASGMIEMQAAQATPEEILEEARRPDTSFARVKELHGLMQTLRYDGVMLPDERGQDVPLVDQLVKIGKQKRAAEHKAAGEQASQVRVQALKALDPDDQWVVAIDSLASVGDEETLRADFLGTFGDKPDDDPRKKALLTLLDLKRAELQRIRPAAA